MATNKEQVISLLKNKGYSKAAIAGIIGNIDVETGGTFDYQQKQKKGSGYGLFQFDFMKKHYNKWLKDNKLKDSAKAQVDFFHDTVFGDSQDVIGRGNALKVQAALQQEDPERIATDLSDIWLKPGKPHIQRRQASALNIFNTLDAPPVNTRLTPQQMEQAVVKQGVAMSPADIRNYRAERDVRNYQGMEPGIKEALGRKEASLVQRIVEGVVPSAQAKELPPRGQPTYDYIPQQAEPQYATMEDLLMDKGLIQNPLLFDDKTAEQMWRQF